MPDARPVARTLLPIQPLVEQASIAVDIRDQITTLCAAADITAPSGAPDIVVILLDDMGFGASSAFGGPCEMPASEALAENGLRFTRFHTTAICSATRAALLTGRNHHSVGFGQVVDAASGAPGYSGRLPRSAATVARVLQENGYATGAFGKMHETPKHEITQVGPFDRWPTVGEGFDKFYGFMSGEINHWYPTLYDGTTAIEQPRLPEEGYHLSEDIVDQAISWVTSVKSFAPHQPFFSYLSFGATHAPFHVHREWVEKYRGRFDRGWNRQREITLARQKELGVVPLETELAPWAFNLPNWDELDERQRRSAAALMETYAGFAEHTDAQIGRFTDALGQLGLLDNTLIIYILGDNGASGEGGLEGVINGVYANWNGVPDTPETILSEVGKLGGHETWPLYPAGWALAMDTPYQWVKQIASHYGGTRNGLIVHWPDGIASRGELRHQWQHVIDVAPTVLEAASLPVPAKVDGFDQMPMHGVSMLYAFHDHAAPDRHVTQYFEMGGSRAIYHEGWIACSLHRPAPWDMFSAQCGPFIEDRWELYDTNRDWSQTVDVSTEYPEKLAHLQELFLVEAARYQVLPLDDRPLAVRLSETKNIRSVLSRKFYAGTRRAPIDAMPNILNHSHSILARIECHRMPHGVVCAHGGRFSGWSLYFVDGYLRYCHNVGGGVRYFLRSEIELGPGTHDICYDFRYDGGSKGSGGTGRLSVDGQTVCRGRIEKTIAWLFPLGEHFNVGLDPITPVTDEYLPFDNAFDGLVHSVTISIEEESPDQTCSDDASAELATH